MRPQLLSMSSSRGESGAEQRLRTEVSRRNWWISASGAWRSSSRPAGKARRAPEASSRHEAAGPRSVARLPGGGRSERAGDLRRNRQAERDVRQPGPLCRPGPGRAQLPVFQQDAAEPACHGKGLGCGLRSGQPRRIPDESRAVAITFKAGYETKPGPPATSTVPDPLKVAILLLVGHWYQHREAVSAAGMAPLPFAVEALVAPYRRICF